MPSRPRPRARGVAPDPVELIAAPKRFCRPPQGRYRRLTRIREKRGKRPGKGGKNVIFDFFALAILVSVYRPFRATRDQPTGAYAPPGAQSLWTTRGG